MSNIIAIETSVPAASIALSIDSQLVIEECFESHRQQNKLLFPALEVVINHLKSLTKKPDLIIVGTGPGSYSGSRISIAAAQGLGVALGCPVVGLCSFLATQTLQENPIAYAIGDARRGSFFIAKMDQSIADFTSELLEENEFTARVESLTEPKISFEDELPCSDFITEKPQASLLIEAWKNLSESTREKVLNLPPQPHYLRPPFITKAKPGHPLFRNKS